MGERGNRELRLRELGLPRRQHLDLMLIVVGAVLIVVGCAICWRGPRLFARLSPPFADDPPNDSDPEDPDGLRSLG